MNEEKKEHNVYAIKFASQQMLIDKLQNNWNELKKWLEEVIEDINKLEFPDSYDISEKVTLKNIVKKMQELEQGKNE